MHERQKRQNGQNGQKRQNGRRKEQIKILKNKITNKSPLGDLGAEKAEKKKS